MEQDQGVKRMKLFFVLALLFSNQVFAEEEKASQCILEVPIVSAIGPATLDLVDRTLKQAEERNCNAVLAVINTPGGSLQSTRYIVERILNTDIPFLCLVGPSGAHAGSAGAIILQACHVAGAMEATNIGAATPVAGGGQEMGEDMRNKIMNDTRSWVEGLAKLRGRDEKFAKDIVELAKAVSAEEALRINAIEWVGTKKEDFVNFANDKEVKLSESKTVKLKVSSEPIVEMPLDFRYQVLDIVTHPQFAYLIFMGSIGLLYFELTHPGVIVPGVIGAVGLAISLMSMHMLDITSTGILLILLGIGLMIAEAFVASFGALGLGGVVAFFLGSLFLYDPSFSGYSLPLQTILPTTLLLGLLMIGVAYLAFSTRQRRSQNTSQGVLGHKGRVRSVSDDLKHGQVFLMGELWSFQSNDQLQINDLVIVTAIKGFKLTVEKINEESS